jgi:hypothetical protein
MVLLQGVKYLTYRGNLGVFTCDSLKSTEVAKLLHEFRNVTESIYSLAHYVGIALRSHDRIPHNQERERNRTKRSSSYIASTHRVKGTVYIDKLRVAVRWACLTLLIFVALLNGFLLAITIPESHIQCVGLWKYKTLALLLYSE